jgi:hypothetical protein
MERALKAFEKDIKKWTNKLEKNIVPKKIRGLGLQTLSMLMKKSPVDEGVFRGNWNVGVNIKDRSTKVPKKKKGKKKKANRNVIDPVKFAEGEGRIGSVKLGDTINISNALPYAMRLEFGYSAQRPDGMVRTTIMELRFWLKKQNEKL